MAPTRHKKISSLRANNSWRRAITRKDLYRKGQALQLLRSRIDAILAQDNGKSQYIDSTCNLFSSRRLDLGLPKLEPADALDKSPDYIRSITSSQSHPHQELNVFRKSMAPPTPSPPKKLPCLGATSIGSLSRMLQGLQVATSSIFPFFSLPPELRDEIYVYASVTEGIETWIGTPPLFEGQKDSIVEKRNQTTFVKTSNRIIGLNHQARSEFRWAVWRDYMTTTRTIDLRVHDFESASIESFFNSCSLLQLGRIRQPTKGRLRIHLTRNFHKYRLLPRAEEAITLVLIDWVKFCNVNQLSAEQSLDRSDWYDIRLLKPAFYGPGSRRLRARREWAARIIQLIGKRQSWRQTWIPLCRTVLVAEVDCNAAMEKQRSAYKKLGPLGR